MLLASVRRYTPTLVESINLRDFATQSEVKQIDVAVIERVDTTKISDERKANSI